MKDSALQFMINNGLCRGCVVRIDDTIKEILSKRTYQKEVAKVMSEAISLAVCFTYSLKTSGLFSLRIDGEGALKLLCAEINEKGEIRAYADYDKNAEFKDSSVQSLFKSGSMSFIFDMMEKNERYQGIIELNKPTLSECAEAYFKNSEQIDTAIKIFSQDNAKSGAFFIQRMPTVGGSLKSFDDEEIDDMWRSSVIMLGSLTSQELLDEKISKQDLIYRLYNGNTPILLGKKSVKFGCRCSKEKALNACKTVSKEEREALPEVDITCEFCGEGYKITKEELINL